jgi:transposase
MARYKEYSYEQGKLIPISFAQQIIPGTFEFALNYIIDNEMDLSVFKNRYRNDATGAKAYDPAILLKVILYAYSRGIISSRSIARACEENVIFMALSADTHPHFTTIADFISTMQDQITPLFRDVLLLCSTDGLIDKKMFAIDGCKISSNCSKEWSGTKADLHKKMEKIEKSVNFLVSKHKQTDAKQQETDQYKREVKAIKNLSAKAKKIKQWLKDNDDKRSTRKKLLQSNITDNESVKMPTSHGVVQGYTGSVAVDSKHQVIVHAEAFGLNQETSVLEPMIDGVEENFKETRIDKKVLKKATIVADTGYHSGENISMLEERGIDAYIPDTLFRKRDSRFATAEAHRKSTDKDKAKYYHKRFHAADFIYNKEVNTLTCPAGNTLQCINKAFRNDSGLIGPQYRAEKSDCIKCIYKDKCLQGSKQHPRTVAIFKKRDPNMPKSSTEKMIEKFDTDQGRYLYSRRMGIVEPVFSYFRNNYKFNWFTLRSQKKVDVQWKLISIVHNMSKLFRYSDRFEKAVA